MESSFSALNESQENSYEDLIPTLKILLNNKLKKMNNEYVMDFDKFLVESNNFDNLDEMKKSKMKEGEEEVAKGDEEEMDDEEEAVSEMKKSKMKEAEAEAEAEVLDAEEEEVKKEVEKTNEKFENEIVEIIEDFATEMETEFTNLNESERLDSLNLLPIIETILNNPTDEAVMDSVIETLETFEEINEAADPGATTKKKSLFGKVKSVADALWAKLKEWAAVVKKKISAINDPAKRKAAFKKFKVDYKTKKDAVIEKIKASKKGVSSKLKNLKNLFRKKRK